MSKRLVSSPFVRSRRGSPRDRLFTDRKSFSDSTGAKVKILGPCDSTRFDEIPRARRVDESRLEINVQIVSPFKYFPRDRSVNIHRKNSPGKIRVAKVAARKLGTFERPASRFGARRWHSFHAGNAFGSRKSARSDGAAASATTRNGVTTMLQP